MYLLYSRLHRWGNIPKREPGTCDLAALLFVVFFWVGASYYLQEIFYITSDQLNFFLYRINQLIIVGGIN